MIYLGKEIVLKCGYDVIKNLFFVYTENDGWRNKEYFHTFGELYHRLKGKVYKNSCYYQYAFSKGIIKKYNLDVSKLANTHFIDYTVDDWDSLFEETILADYKEAEITKRSLDQWIAKFVDCDNKADFVNTYKKFEKSKVSQYEDIIIDCYIRKQPEVAFDILMALENEDEFYGHVARDLCFRFDPEIVLNEYNPQTQCGWSMSSSVKKSRKKKLRNFVKALSEEFSLIECKKGFDKKTHFYYVTKKYEKEKVTGFDDFENDNCYFATFEEFAEYLNYDLSGCDLFDMKPGIDFSKYTTDNKTIIPFKNNKIHSVIFKTADKNHFEVKKCWYDENENLVFEKEESFDFCDFVYFLNGDLSDIDFVSCFGLIHLNSIEGLNISNCAFSSEFMDKFGIKYDDVSLDPKEYSFDLSQKNEESTELVLQNKNDIMCLDEKDESAYLTQDYNKIFYISDLHLLHRIANCKTEYERKNVLNNIAGLFNCGYYSRCPFELIGGDVSSNYELYQDFINRIFVDYQNSIKEFRFYEFYDDYINRKFVFVLGNHELWSFPDKSFDEIVKIYKEELGKYGFYLLQNSIVYRGLDDKTYEIDEETLLSLSEEALRNQLQHAQLILFGGMGFSGLNKTFNANVGLYLSSVSREQEIKESEKFEFLYRKVCSALYDKNVIIFTHMPKDNWTDDEYMENFVYVSGHTHRNEFYDDGTTRIYADNQIGYRQKEVSLKYFYIEKEYDLFADYEDGIYKITPEEYRDFNKAKNVQMSYNRTGEIYMLKREGYYCFFRQGEKRLQLLNGGSMIGVDNDIKYYYDNMPYVIADIRKPFDKYTSIQKKISEQVKKIGGSGRIHGAIIDIDFWNHIYLNPNDLTLAGYFAHDIISKYVYQNIPSLLKAKCPELYANYKKLLSDKAENALIVAKNDKIDTKPLPYFETDIYKASRELKKMQKLNKGVLSTWHEPDIDNNLLLTI